jgi:hypothetical protein
MSALGQKQTCAAQNGMSALTPKADMCSATRHVRFEACLNHISGSKAGVAGTYNQFVIPLPPLAQEILHSVTTSSRKLPSHSSMISE